MIRYFKKEDIEEVEKLCLMAFGNEVEMDLELKTFIYRFLPRYYLTKDDRTLVDFEEKINGFFIVMDEMKSKSGIQFFYENVIKLSIENQIKARKYKEYLDFNHEKVISHMRNNSRYLALVISQKKGTGSKLFKEVIQKAKEDGFKHLYLWTDETCNYTFYEREGFILEETYSVSLFERKIKTFIYRIDI